MLRRPCFQTSECPKVGLFPGIICQMLTKYPSRKDDDTQDAPELIRANDVPITPQATRKAVLHLGPDAFLTARMAL
jgi:hypothetical protein